MPKRKQKRAPRRIDDPVADEKINKLKALWAEFKTQCQAYETHLSAICEQQNEQIAKLYMDKLACIPENIRKMTIAEVIAHQEKERIRKTECPKDENAIRALLERQRATTEKKRTNKKERKRSTSANASTRPLTINRPPTNAFPRISRAISDSSLATPIGRFGRVSNMVTPKFDPSLPVSNMARKAKPNELVMSISGSPLLNTVDNSKLTLSLGHIKLLTYDNEAKIDEEFVKKLDEPMKKILKDVKDQLDQILQSR